MKSNQKKAALLAAGTVVILVSAFAAWKWYKKNLDFSGLDLFGDSDIPWDIGTEKDKKA